MSAGAVLSVVAVWVLGWTAAVVAWAFPRPRRPYPSPPQGLRPFDPASRLRPLDPRPLPNHHPTRSVES
ncbi:hypothetical protein SAURM35S_06827 [Streptomyces aurantiogriseus]